MKINKSQRIPTCAAMAAYLLLSTGAHILQADTLTPGTPTSGGVDFVWIHDGNGWHIVPVDIPAGETQEQKTVDIATAIQNAGFSASSGENLDGSGHVDIGSGDKWVYHSHTGEADTAGLSTAASVAYFGFDGDLSGIAFPGQTATYSAAIDFGSVNDVSVVSFSSLSTQSINGLLAATYANLEAGLPAAFQSDLILDLTGGDLTFSIPAGVLSASVTTQSLDIAVGSFVGANASTPEPSSLLLLGLGLAAIFLGSYRRASVPHP